MDHLVGLLLLVKWLLLCLLRRLLKHWRWQLATRGESTGSLILLMMMMKVRHVGNMVATQILLLLLLLRLLLLCWCSWLSRCLIQLLVWTRHKLRLLDLRKSRIFDSDYIRLGWMMRLSLLLTMVDDSGWNEVLTGRGGSSSFWWRLRVRLWRAAESWQTIFVCLVVEMICSLGVLPVANVRVASRASELTLGGRICRSELACRLLCLLSAREILRSRLSIGPSFCPMRVVLHRFLLVCKCFLRICL